MIIEITSTKPITLHEILSVCELDEKFEKMKVLTKFKKKYTLEEIDKICSDIQLIYPDVDVDNIYKLLNIAAVATTDDIRYLLKLPVSINPDFIFKLL